MTKLFSTTTILVGLSTTQALANGDHGGDAFHVFAHMLTEPDHLAMLSVAVVVAIFAIRKYRSQI